MNIYFPDDRTINDLLGEALRRYVEGSIRPLWADMPEGPEKQRWREKGRAIFDFSRAQIQGEKAAKGRTRS